MTQREQDIHDLNELNFFQCEKSTYERKLAECRAELVALGNEHMRYNMLSTNNYERLLKEKQARIEEANKAMRPVIIAIAVITAIMAFVVETFMALGILLSVVVVAIGGAAIAIYQKKKTNDNIDSISNAMAGELQKAQQKDKDASIENARREQEARRAFDERQKASRERIDNVIAFHQEKIKECDYKVKSSRMYGLLTERDRPYAWFLAQQMESNRADTLKEALLQLDHKRENEEKIAREEKWRQEDLARMERQRAEDIARREREREEDMRREEAYRRDQERRYREDVDRQERNRREDIARQESYHRDAISRQESQRKDDQQKLDYELRRIRDRLDN